MDSDYVKAGTAYGRWQFSSLPIVRRGGRESAWYPHPDPEKTTKIFTGCQHRTSQHELRVSGTSGKQNVGLSDTIY